MSSLTRLKWQGKKCEVCVGIEVQKNECLGKIVISAGEDKMVK